MSSSLFARLLSGGRESAASFPVELGVVRLRDGAGAASTAEALRKVLPASLTVMTKGQMVEFERHFAAELSSAGPIFWLGTIVGFAVGILISYQIIYTDLADQLPQYATLKAIGYENGYLMRIVLAQSAFYALVGFIPAWILGIILFGVVGELALLPMTMTPALTAISLALTLGMCLLSGLVAVRRVASADPAELF